jgi:predicted membrane protein
MPTKLRRLVITILAVQVIAWAIGQVVTRRLTKGDEDSDDFRVAAIMGGRTFHSHARQFTSGAAIAGMGGIDIDLRDATLDPRGATLDLNATMGGIQVVVPEGWAVDIDANAVAGGVDSNVTPVDDLPDDAPRLHIHAVTRMGGALVTTSPSS